MTLQVGVPVDSDSLEVRVNIRNMDIKYDRLPEFSDWRGRFALIVLRRLKNGELCCCWF